MNPFDLKGRTVLVTGASSGIGRECAISCSMMGARLVLIGRDVNRLTETLEQVQKQNEEIHTTFAVDITDEQQVDEMIKQVKEQVGTLHGVVHCAGISAILPLKAVSTKKMDEFLKINVVGPYQLTKNLVKAGILSETDASIIFLSSVMASVGEVGRSLYGMTKSALLGACKSLAVELASKRIRVNCISPGVVVTPMSNRSLYSQDEESRKKIEALHPLGFGQPDDVANACIFLLSSASKWVTGIDLIVDGGYTAR